MSEGALLPESERGPTGVCAEASALDALGRVEALTREVHALENEQSQFVLAQIDHLREVAVLNRASDSLRLNRTYPQIIEQLLTEASNVGAADGTWFVEPDSGGALVRACCLNHGRLCDVDPPLEVVDLFARALEYRNAEAVTLPSYDPTAPDAIFTGLPLVTPGHFMGLLVVKHTDIAIGTDSQRRRLLETVAQQAAIACENTRLFETVSRLIVNTVIAMAMAVESRDPYTGGHVMRVTAYAYRLGEKLGLDSRSLSRLRLGGLLHDIGKIAVPDAILRKPGKLDDAEFEVMKSHAAVGHQIISNIPQLASVGPIIRHHHERYDGRGYPDHIAGENICDLARVAAIADTYDAMTSDRPYRKGLSYEIAMAEVRKHAGTQFDPDMAAVYAGLSPDELSDAVEKMQAWMSGDHGDAVANLLQVIDVDRPRIQP
ncbi:MAG: HD domain-containing protein [Phycisphaera sp.]|nr:HD domain-containing protein [Phycisphaera sp.]